jgi:N-acetyl sugar amidotransferase
MPDSRPGSTFVDGVCGACRNFDTRKDVDWEHREREFDELLREAKSKPNEDGYDILIPVSGGKDSHRLVYEAKRRGMNPVCVTVTDSFTHTKAGTDNLRNLITRWKVNHYTYTINHDLFVRATRWAFESTGEALKFVEYAIYTIPYMMAKRLGISLVLFGENSSFEYGSVSENSPDANAAIAGMFEKAQKEKEWWAKGGIKESEVDSILPTFGGFEPKVVYASYYYPWSSVTNLEIATRCGFKTLEGEWDRKGTCENFEQMDSVAYMVHLWLKYPKFGFQRVSDIASRRVREEIMSLEEAKQVIAEKDSELDPWALQDFCRTCGYTEREFWQVIFQSSWNKYMRRPNA